MNQSYQSDGQSAPLGDVQEIYIWPYEHIVYA